MRRCYASWANNDFYISYCSRISYMHCMCVARARLPFPPLYLLSPQSLLLPSCVLLLFCNTHQAHLEACLHMDVGPSTRSWTTPQIPHLEERWLYHPSSYYLPIVSLLGVGIWVHSPPSMLGFCLVLI